MGTFTKIPVNTWDGIQLDAGVLLTQFDPAAPACEDEYLLCATSGGIQVNCTATYSDFAEDVDNAPNNILEFKHLDGWDCNISFTSLAMSLDLIKWTLGAWQPTAENGGIMPRQSLKVSDANELWWVGDVGEKKWVAIRIRNALSTGGLALQTGKNAKGQVSVTVTGHIKLDEQDLMPMEFYTGEFEASYTVMFSANGHGTAPTAQTITENSLATEPTDPAATGYTFGGWYKEAACVNEWDFTTDKVTEDITLYAKWTAD